MASVNCKAGGVSGEPNLYEGLAVVVIYRYSGAVATLPDSVMLRDGWAIEEGTVSNGTVSLSGPGPLTNERYYIGLKYKSRVKTLPIRGQNRMNSKGRLSRVSLYFADNVAEGAVTVGGESSTGVAKAIVLSDTFEKGRYDVNIGTSFEEEPYVEIEATGIHGFNLLALDVDYKQSER